MLQYSTKTNLGTAGFYPVTVSYLSLFYTRFEFGRRLSLFYGQAAVGGALGGIISWAVFSSFPKGSEDHGSEGDPDVNTKWQSWQVLFMLEGGLTILVALAGYFWLPHNAETAWFLTLDERAYASSRIVADRASQIPSIAVTRSHAHDSDPELNPDSDFRDEESRGLLDSGTSKSQNIMDSDVTNDRGLTPHDFLSAFASPKIWHILTCNILSAIPVYAFQVFLPLVLAPLTETPNPALVNLLTAPPYICGAITLYVFASYSDRHRKRIMPILWGLALLIIGLTIVVLLPTSRAWAIPRYLALNVLLSGTFIASPLTVAWISGNTPSPGKRALLLGINGWGNLAGVLSALLFKPKYANSGYIIPFWWTLLCVGIAAAGYVLFYRNLRSENEYRRKVLGNWDAEDVEKENVDGSGPLENKHGVLSFAIRNLKTAGTFHWAAEWLEEAIDGGRQGDEKITFVYGL